MTYILRIYFTAREFMDSGFNCFAEYLDTGLNPRLGAILYNFIKT